MSGRGQRSAVGTHGFLHGGLIVDAGRAKGERLGRLAQQCPLPEDWRFVLVRGSAATGLSGQAEAAAIDALPPIPEDGFQRLQKLVETQLLPAARAADWASFGEALYAYGLQAGNYFAPAQGGPFASTAISERVELIRSLGIPGVGQSSWGPTLYAVTADQQQAQRLVTQLQAQPSCADCQFRIARPNNTGVQVRCT
jgi:beta-RFAP synthase